MALAKGGSFGNEPIEMGRVHVAVAEAADRVVTLLVRNNEDNIWAIRHRKGFLLRWKMRIDWRFIG